ncbi:MAG TPA: methionyl-tRNA formyltransferase [Candidatus Krumholzibacteria bacterium]|nr:methionyl-tRNA formyltransferase [Candidatus Krumholzibacteria bacterium]
MRAVFCGSPDFAVPALDAVVDAGFEVPLVVSQPDRVRGRRGKATPTPVRARGVERGLDTAVLERGKANRVALYERVLALEPDIVLVVAFGHIVREPLLGGARLGCLNVHASLLPRWRGPAPIHTAIVAGDDETGVCTMELAAGVDTGDVYDVSRTSIEPNLTAGELHDRLAVLGADLLVSTLRRLDEGDTHATPQPEEGITHAPMLSKSEGSVDFDAPCRRVHDRVRGFDPWPGVTVRSGEVHLKLSGSRALSLPAREAPGTIETIDDEGMLVACADDLLLVRRVQPAGRRPMRPIECARGHGLAVGAALRPVEGFEPVEPRL